MSLIAQLTRSDIEEFLFREAAFLDEWELLKWRDLFLDDCRYIVPNLALDPDTPVEETLHLVVDDGHHLTERVKRLGKKTAHAEYPRSRTRRMVSNVLIVEQSEDALRANSSFVTFRASQGVIDTYFGQHRYLFVEHSGQLKIKEKKTVLDMGALRPQGRLSIIV